MALFSLFFFLQEKDLLSVTNRSPASVSRKMEYGFLKGQQYTYDFNYFHKSQLNDEDVYNVTITGKILINALAEKGDEKEVLFKIMMQDLKTESVESGDGKEDSGDLEIEILVSMDKLGKISWHFTNAKEVRDFHVLAKSIVYSIVQSLPQAINENQEYFGFDEIGKYIATLEEQKNDSWVVEKQRYLSILSPEFSKFKITFSNVRFVWDLEKQTPLFLNLEEIREMEDKTFTLRRSDSAQFSFVSSRPSNLSFNRDMFKTKIARKAVDENIGLSEDRLKFIQSLALEQVLTTLSQVSGLTPKEINALFRDVTDFLKHRPDQIEKYVHKIKELAGDAEKEQSYLVGIDALGYPGSKEAQNGLIDIYSDSNATDDGKDHCLRAFVLMDAEFTDEAVEFLTNEYEEEGNDEETRDSSLFALGSSLRKGKSKGTQEYIIRLWNSAKTQDDRMKVLLTIGNSGRVEFLPILREAMNKFSGFKIPAILATRFMDGPAVYTFYNQLISDNTDAKVYRSVFSAISSKEWNADKMMPMIKRCIGSSDLQEQAKVYCISAGVHFADSWPGVIDVLKPLLDDQSYSDNFKKKVSDDIAHLSE